MKVGEFGRVHNLNVNYGIGAFTTLTLVYTRPGGTTFTRTGSDVTAPAVSLVTPNLGTFAASQYSRYVFKDGDLTVPGDYTVQLTYTDATKRIRSNLTSFTVSA